MLSMMISGPRQFENDTDVYLNPLIEDLKFLWDDGVEVFDGFANESFQMHACYFVLSITLESLWRQCNILVGYYEFK